MKKVKFTYERYKLDGYDLGDHENKFVLVKDDKRSVALIHCQTGYISTVFKSVIVRNDVHFYSPEEIEEVLSAARAIQKAHLKGEKPINKVLKKLSS